MKRVLLATAILVSVSPSVLLASAPPIIWFQDDFEAWPTQKLADCVPDWGQARVVEPGTVGPWAGGTTDVNVKQSGAACSGYQYVIMQGYEADCLNTLSNPLGRAAETCVHYVPETFWNPHPNGDQEVLLHFTMRRSIDEMSDPPLHAGVYLIDVFGNSSPIMGWVMSTHKIKPQLNLPTFAGPTWTTNRYCSPEGTEYALPAGDNCQAFTAAYYPATGEVRFYVDAVSETVPLWTGNAGANRHTRCSVYVRDYLWHGAAGPADVVLLDDLAVGWSDFLTYQTISAAAVDGWPGKCSIRGDAVITAVRRLEGAQIGFWVQDVGTKDHMNIFIPTTSTTNVAVGRKVIGLSGIFSLVAGGGIMLDNPAFTVTTEDVGAFPIGMAQRSLGGGGHVSEYGGGAKSTNRFVRTWGRIKAVVDTAEGGKAVYIDDGSGLVDGRSVDGDPTATGARILASDPAFTGSVGEYWRVDGICAYETWTEGATSKTVRTILCPSLRKLL